MRRLTDPSFSLPVSDNCDPSPCGVDWIYLTQETFPDLSMVPDNWPKNRIAVYKNLLHTMKRVGLSRCAQGVFTFPKGTPSNRARAVFRRARPFLKQVFITWISFLQLSPNGFWHYHFFAVLPEGIAEGFRWDLFFDPEEEVRPFFQSAEEI